MGEHCNFCTVAQKISILGEKKKKKIIFLAICLSVFVHIVFTL